MFIEKVVDIWACASVLLPEESSGYMAAFAHLLPVRSCQCNDLIVLRLQVKCAFLLQKSLLESCQSRVDRRGELKSLKNTCEKAQKTLQEKEKELAAARAENETLRLQVLKIQGEVRFIQIEIVKSVNPIV